jgi:hypothetical protein
MPVPDATIPVDSAIADTAFKNLEPAFINLTFFPMPRSELVPTPVRVAVLTAFLIQARELVNFCLLQLKPCPNGHYEVALS